MTEQRDTVSATGVDPIEEEVPFAGRRRSRKQGRMFSGGNDGDAALSDEILLFQKLD